MKRRGISKNEFIQKQQPHPIARNHFTSTPNAIWLLRIRYATPEGKVIEKTVEFDQSLPIEVFDYETKEGFLRDFDKRERAVIQARDKMSEQLLDSIMSEVNSKKQGQVRQRIKPNHSSF